MSRVLSKEQLERFSVKWLAGDPLKEIANEIGTTQHYASIIRARLGLPKRNPYQSQFTSRGGLHARWLWQRDTLTELWEQGCSDHQIAERLGRTPDGVRQERMKLNLPSQNEVGLIFQRKLMSYGVPVEQSAFLSGDVHGSRAIANVAALRWRKIQNSALLENGQWDVRRRLETKAALRIAWFRERNERRANIRAHIQFRPRLERHTVKPVQELTPALSWRTEELFKTISQFDELGASNQVIADILGIGVSHLYSVRSQLGLLRKKSKVRKTTIKDARSRILPDYQQ